MFSPEVKNIFDSRTQLLLQKHMFPSLDAMKTMSISFQCRSLIKEKTRQILLPYRHRTLSLLLYLGLLFGFHYLRRPNRLLSYTKQLFLCRFDADALLKVERHVYIRCIACSPGDGRENVNILPQTSSEVSLSLHACVTHLLSQTFPRFATGKAKHQSVCFPLI